MKDIMQKLAELEATAPKVTKKKMLKEDSTTPPMNVSNKAASFKDVFAELSENVVPGQKPLPVLDPQKKQAGMGFVTSDNPAVQNMLKNLDPKDVQIVQAPGQPGQPQVGQQQQQPTGQPAQAGATGQPMQGQMQMKEKDEGKPGKNFAKIAKSAGERYGSKAAGERVAGAVRAKLAKQGKLEEENLDELSPKTLKSYAKKADIDNAVTNRELKNRYHTGLDPDLMKQSSNRTKGMKLAGAKMMGRAKVPAKDSQLDEKLTKSMSAGDIISDFEKSKDPKFKGKSKEERKKQALGAYYDMHPEKSKKKTNESSETEYKVLGQCDKQTSNGYDTRPVSIKVKATNEKEAKKLATEKLSKNHKNYRATKVESLTTTVKEGDIPSSSGVDTRGAGLGAGRSATTLEGKKPDFLDLDKDGNKKKPMSKAAADKKKQKVKESMNHRISAARLEGKSHGLRGHAHSGKRYEDLDEIRAYHEGYKEGLDECYGQGVYETAPAMPAATVGGMASHAMPTMEDDVEEGNAFTAALAKTPKGGKFSVGGKTFTDRSNYGENVSEYAFESLDQQLNALLNESEDLSEGLSVSISKGQQNSPDSVTITAQDQEAEHLLAFVKNAGLGLFGDDNADTHSSAMSIQPAHGAPDEVGSGGVDIGVVDGHDGMMGLMQKLSGVEAGGAEDYADEEGDEEHLYGNHEEASEKDCGCDGDCGCDDYDQPTNEATCNECGMMETHCGCSGDKEMVDEVETEDQMEFEVSEDNAPDSDEAETSADEDAEAKEDAALAGAMSKDEEEVNESTEEDEEDVTESNTFESIFKKFAMLEEAAAEDEEDVAEEKTEKKGMSDKQAKFFGKKADKEKVDEWANNAGPGKTVSDTTFEQDIDFMTQVISGGLNKPKSTGQTTVPVIAGQTERMGAPKEAVTESVSDWVKLAGIK